MIGLSWVNSTSNSLSLKPCGCSLGGYHAEQTSVGGHHVVELLGVHALAPAEIGRHPRGQISRAGSRRHLPDPGTAPIRDIAIGMADALTVPFALPPGTLFARLQHLSPECHR